jgi:multicomponent Na+:H+ antiporter subunit D
LIPLHTWLPDSYPRATLTGSVFLAVFTTKTGVYTLARFFPGDVFLVTMGGAMALYGVVFALLQNDTRKLLSYHIISQLGYMLAGIGVGTELGLDGSIAHLFNNNLFKPLLFMCMGSIIYVTGRSKLTELGGLAKAMPVTCITCVIASLSISGAPGFNGFVSKGMVIASVAEAHRPVVELMLRLATVGTFLSFAKLTYFSFFAKHEPIQAEDPPFNMRLAMIATAFACVLLGVYPQALFDVLPHYAGEYRPYTWPHTLGVFQLFFLAGLVFVIFTRAFSPHRWLVLDFDYFYRMAFRRIGHFCSGPLNDFRLRTQTLFSWGIGYLVFLAGNPLNLAGRSAAYLRRSGGRTSSFLEDFWKGQPMAYNEDTYRKPMGLGVLLAILFLFFYALFYLITS